MSIEKLLHYITNPVAYKILLCIEKSKQATAKELLSRNNDLPQATLYRYLNKMTADGVLAVAEERQVRNVTEKIYVVNLDYKTEIEKIIHDNSGLGYCALFQQFCNGLISEFQAYAARENINILNDGSGFRIVPFYATTDELKEMAEKIRDILTPYHENKPTPERQMRTIAIIYTPPSD